jgi:hypothetical protein
MPATEYVERQVAVAIIIAVEEPALLVPMDRVIRGIQIQGDLTWWRPEGIEEEVDEHGRDRGRIVPDAVIACRGDLGRGVFEPVERALAGQRLAAVAAALT